MNFLNSSFLLLLKLGSAVPDPVDIVLLEDVLATVTTKTAIIKIDVEGYECKVRKKSVHPFETNFSYVNMFFYLKLIFHLTWSDQTLDSSSCTWPALTLSGLPSGHVTNTGRRDLTSDMAFKMWPTNTSSVPALIYCNAVQMLNMTYNLCICLRFFETLTNCMKKPAFLSPTSS